MPGMLKQNTGGHWCKMAKIGNYEIIKEIAIDSKGEPVGGMGRIFQAKHIYLDELACIKQNKAKEFEDVLYNEAKILWRLNEHHSIPTVKDFFPVADSYVMVMDYIDGPTLDSLIEKNSRMHPEDASWITERLLSALQYSTYKGIVHGDIKPGNLFIEAKHHDVKLIDWGLASYKPKSTSKQMGYTPRYVAPEIRDGKSPIPESDVYGTGMIMLYALGGDVDSKEFRDETPEPIKEFCSRLIRYDPMQRPSLEKENLAKALSDIREQVFGRRHMK